LAKNRPKRISPARSPLSGRRQTSCRLTRRACSSAPVF
jgi:hypothetical protein